MHHQFTAPPPTRVARTSSTSGIGVLGIEDLKSVTRTVLDNAGVTWSPNRIVKVCLRFARDVRGTGWDFFDFITTELAISAEEKRNLRDDPEVQRIFRFGLDPTGEQAVGNVMRERGY